MVTLDYVVLETIANLFLLIFSILLMKEKRFSWLFLLMPTLMKIYIYGKYSILLSTVYLSAEILAVSLVTIMWFKNYYFIKLNKKLFIKASLISVLLLVLWVFAVYKLINPAILSFEMLFGFGYLCYMIFVIGCVFLAFRTIYSLIMIAVVFISYALSYGQVAMAAKNMPVNGTSFSICYGLSALFLFIAGIVLVSKYTQVNRSFK